MTDSDSNIVETTRESKSRSATWIAFEKLRDSAVENLCKALRVGIKTNEKDIVKALIASVSNRLYTQDKAKDAQLMSQVRPPSHDDCDLPGPEHDPHPGAHRRGPQARGEGELGDWADGGGIVGARSHQHTPAAIVVPFCENCLLQVAENILIFFQQKFCRSHSNPDMDRC